MAFCNNCGSELPEGAKFCHICGHETGMTNVGQAQRQQVFEGALHKCPNCGELLGSFNRNCPTCGFELRGVKSSSAVKEFAAKLASVEASRTEGRKLFGFRRKKESDIVKQKIDIIQNYPVPNTKEDMLEFIVLATSNINPSVYNSDQAINIELADAWLSKAKQVYEKAFSTYGNDIDIVRVKELYIDCENKIKKEKRKKTAKGIFEWVALIGWMPLVVIIIVVIVNVTQGNKNNSEEERLNNLVPVIEQAIENEDYQYALRVAESMEYNGYDSEREKWWNIQKVTLVDRTIELASQKGIYLEPSPTPTVKPTPTSDVKNEDEKK